MRKMVRLFKKCLPIIAVAVILNIVFWAWTAYMERRSCICFNLTYEEQEFPIDDKLSQVWSIENLWPGSYSLLSTQCRHEKHIQMFIDPDRGIYRAQLIQPDTHEDSIGGLVERDPSYCR